MGQPVLHGTFNAVAPDFVVIAVTFGLISLPAGLAGNGANVADYLRRQGTAGIHALGTHGDFHAGQVHGARLHLDDRFILHVFRNGNGLGVEHVHLHFRINGHDLQHGGFIHHQAFCVAKALGFFLGRPHVCFGLRIGQAEALLQGIQAIFRCGIGGGIG